MFNNNMVKKKTSHFVLIQNQTKKKSQNWTFPRNHKNISK